MTEPDDLRRSLDNVAATIDVGDLDLAAVRTHARRRRRRAQLTAGLGVAALVVGATVAVVAFNAGDEPDTLVSAEADESAPSTSIGDEEPVTTDLSTAPAQTVRVIDRPGVPGLVAGVGGAPEYGEWAAAWKDGFLVGSLAYAPQPLPAELPEEVSALFPQEVRDLFGGELPPTIAEATEMLREAGLLETVTEIILANPEASDAIYSVENLEPPTLDVRFTTDGTTWEPVEVTPPPSLGYISGATAVGDRLVVWYGSQGPDGDVGDGTVRVATTVDLVNWSVQEIVTPPPTGLPDGVTWTVQPLGFAANESGWVASVSTGLNLDPFELIPAADRVGLDPSAGYSFSTDDTGIILDVEGDGVDSVTYTWDELGVTPDVADYFGDGSYVPTTWAASWDGVPATSQTPGPMEGIIATPAGFVGLGSDVRFSADGLTWTTGPLPVEDAYYVTAAFTFDGGIVAFIDTADGVQIHRLDERGGSPERLDIPGLPATANGAYGPGSRLGVVLAATEPGPLPPPLVVEADGHRLTIDPSSGFAEVVTRPAHRKPRLGRPAQAPRKMQTSSTTSSQGNSAPLSFDRTARTVSNISHSPAASTSPTVAPTSAQRWR